MTKLLTRFRIIVNYDNDLIRKNIFSVTFCFGAWAVAVFFLLKNIAMGIATITIFLLVTIQLIASLSDLYNRTIPLKLMISAVIVGLLIFRISYKTNVFIASIVGGIIAFAIMKLLLLISKKQVGGGDLALMTVTGFFAGINAFFSILFISIVLTGIYSLFLVLLKKGNRKTEIPFAPFILLATVILVCSGIITREVI